MGHASAGEIRVGPIVNGDAVTSLPACLGALELRKQLEKTEILRARESSKLCKIFREDDFSNIATLAIYRHESV